MKSHHSVFACTSAWYCGMNFQRSKISLSGVTNQSVIARRRGGYQGLNLPVCLDVGITSYLVSVCVFVGDNKSSNSNSSVCACAYACACHSLLLLSHRLCQSPCITNRIAFFSVKTKSNCIIQDSGKSSFSEHSGEKLYSII